MYFETKKLAVGYEGNILIHDIDIKLEQGKILTLIGPNGAGKSTILKSITRQLPMIQGDVFFNGKEITQWSPKDFAKEVAVLLTDRIRPDLMTCTEVVAMGRYPYTNMFGRLTADDKEKVQDALFRVHALDIAQQDFMTLSDGQRQRILLARAICQEPKMLVLDEPTAYLDIRHKIELMDILREMARKKNIAIIMSLHEIDLATKISDFLLCVKGDTIAAFGAPEEVLKSTSIESLYDMQSGSYNPVFGSVELNKAMGEPRVFVIAGNSKGIEIYRRLQKQQIPFATGILFENDTDTQVARELAAEVITAPPFEAISEVQYEQAARMLQSCEMVIDVGTPIGSFNAMNGKLLELAKASEEGLLAYCREKNLPITFYCAKELKTVDGDFIPSEFVKSVTGVDNVCERSALLGAKELIVRKQAWNGVTIAIAAETQEVRFG